MSKFLTYENRLDLQNGLKEKMTLSAIAAMLGKNPSTISREILKFSTEVASGYVGNPFNECKHRKSCKEKQLCGDDCTHKSNLYCKLCRECRFSCEKFEREVCEARFNPPYACNGCDKLDKCTLMKTIYDAKFANNTSHELICQSRKGLSISAEEIARLNEIVSPLILKGQSVHQIFVNHGDELKCSERSIYNYIDAGLFDAKNMDLPRKVKLRQRYMLREFKLDIGCREGRSYRDYQNFKRKHPNVEEVQMDSVIGRIGGKCLLTIHFVSSSMMLAFLRDANTANSVIEIMDMLDHVLGEEMFNRLFPYILTDNGREFSNPNEIECRRYLRRGGSKYRTNVFYCDVGAPYQKGACEVNHELIRRIIPKETSMDHLTQRDISLMMDHINSYQREKLNDLSPYDIFRKNYGEDILEKLGCHQIKADDIVLKPALLKN